MKKAVSPLFQDLLLDNGTIKDQVYHALRRAILDGRLSAGAKIPSSRALAEVMGISRNSVIAGFERLSDEGYLVTREGAGTFVVTHIPDWLIHTDGAGGGQVDDPPSVGSLNPDITALRPLWSESQPEAAQTACLP
ncbi:HTH-type transcriptional regulatory protein gabR [Raoultella terrigena]|uniref:HTH-type transcriptional regulatory protein gabR n=1 Tax=Raoultella terrigena TaxID=577 RepID=A0A4U9CTM3_RAOTE|nr:HTH-type transcriptional regulatory protein gabR [Raoultella terrigena]